MVYEAIDSREGIYVSVTVSFLGWRKLLSLVVKNR